VERTKEFQDKLAEFLTTRKDGLLRKISEERQLSPALVSELKGAAEQFKAGWK
jgi:hypothetical protein